MPPNFKNYQEPGVHREARIYCTLYNSSIYEACFCHHGLDLTGMSYQVCTYLVLFYNVRPSLSSLPFTINYQAEGNLHQEAYQVYDTSTAVRTVKYKRNVLLLYHRYGE